MTVTCFTHVDQPSSSHTPHRSAAAAAAGGWTSSSSSRGAYIAAVWGLCRIAQQLDIQRGEAVGAVHSHHQLQTVCTAFYVCCCACHTLVVAAATAAAAVGGRPAAACVAARWWACCSWWKEAHVLHIS